MAEAFNDQHARGMDLRGALGGDFFSTADPAVLVSNANSGNGTATAEIGDLSAVTGDDYVLSYDGVTYALANVTTGDNVALGGSGSAADPFVAEGLSIVVSGAWGAGDSLSIRSTANAARSFAVAVSDPQSIAIAAPTRVEASLGNLGEARLTSARTVDAADPNLLVSSTIEFTSATTYSINGAGSFAYTDSQPIVVNGTELVIAGVPQTGDRFTVEANTGAVGDNGNGLILSAVQADKILDGGTVGVGQSYSQLVAEVGGATRQLKANLDAQTVVLDAMETEQIANSGVNLDEEAANLIRFQQAYQAAAQVVSVASTLFDTLIAATRR